LLHVEIRLGHRVLKPARISLSSRLNITLLVPDSYNKSLAKGNKVWV